MNLIARFRDPDTRAATFFFVVLLACAISIGVHLVWTQILKPAHAQITRTE